jgi:putative addiction module killer protein
MPPFRKTKTFRKWLKSLKDQTGKDRIIARIKQAEDGNLGLTKHEREGVHAMLFKTLGYRLYYFQVEKDIYHLLTGGKKNTKEEQTQDINKAVALKYYLERKKQ